MLLSPGSGIISPDDVSVLSPDGTLTISCLFLSPDDALISPSNVHFHYY